MLSIFKVEKWGYSDMLLTLIWHQIAMFEMCQLLKKHAFMHVKVSNILSIFCGAMRVTMIALNLK